MKKVILPTDLKYENMEYELECFDINNNIQNISISKEIVELVSKIKEYSVNNTSKERFCKIICGERPYNMNSVSGLYKNGVAFIVSPTNLVVPCSLLRVYSLFFQSTDKAIELIAELVKSNVAHEEFAKYIYYEHGIKLINCFNTYQSRQTNLTAADFKGVEEVLCVGKIAYERLINGKIIPSQIKTGLVIHSSGLVYNSAEYFQTWHLYQDSCIKHNNGTISFKDFKIF